ncbi:phosphotransferase [Streptomyces sp. NPDC006134]|uniref:phosphotransferase n=1 Tax=Streptomyces sp. NPDC006134 TaxID=3154467 RepID=UPI0033FA372C
MHRTGTSPAREDDLLDTSTVGDHLARRGLVADPADVRASVLGGGVSNIVLSCHVPKGRLLVKQSLGRLRVADTWLAPRTRIVSEARALEITRTLTPTAVPAVIDLDEIRCVLVTEHAPAGWRDWKTNLLSGTMDPRVAAHVGTACGHWHTATRAGGPAEKAAHALGHDAFAALRLDPYHRTVAERRPEWARLLAPYTDELTKRHLCLTHGDLSPKNVLTGGGTWIIDHEVAHYGDPNFDLAFLLHHLLLKSVHLPGRADAARACAEAFWAAYTDRAGPADGRRVGGHTGALLLARTDGRSPAEYLTEAGRTTARRLGVSLLEDPPPGPGGLWARHEQLADRARRRDSEGKTS